MQVQNKDKGGQNHKESPRHRGNAYFTRESFNRELEPVFAKQWVYNSVDSVDRGSKYRDKIDGLCCLYRFE